MFEDPVLLNEELKKTIPQLQTKNTVDKSTSTRGLDVATLCQAPITLPNLNETRPSDITDLQPKTTSHSVTSNNLGAGEVTECQYSDKGTTQLDIPLQDTLGDIRRSTSHVEPTVPVGSGQESSTAYTVICNTQRLHQSTGNRQSADILEHPSPRTGQRIYPTINGNQESNNPHNTTLDPTTIPPPSEGTLRFLHLNTGGISSKAKFLEFQLLLQNILQFNADIFSINEHTLDSSQAPITRHLQDINQQYNKFGQIILASSNETYPRAYKPGGTMVGLTGHISGSKVDEGTYTLGRWAWVWLIGEK